MQRPFGWELQSEPLEKELPASFILAHTNQCARRKPAGAAERARATILRPPCHHSKQTLALYTPRSRSFPQPEQVAVVTPSLQTGKLWPREVKWLLQVTQLGGSLGWADSRAESLPTGPHRPISET